HMEPYHYYGGVTHYWYSHWLPKYGFVVDQIVPQGGPGRTVICYLHAFYQSWRAWDHTLRGVRRALSLAGRMAVKIPVHYFLPWALAKFDPHLNRNQMCVGYMIAATRTELRTENARKEIPFQHGQNQP